ncbi:MAG TPA: chloride channel protein [Leptospiraceae bacterium]|nr:chloride channel protein [Leptospiraceae bacterium]HNN73649.1 chloride channel protein [Leptospiraceae bacterium]
MVARLIPSFIRTSGALYLICLLIGVLTGLGSLIFATLLEKGEGILLHSLVQFQHERPFDFSTLLDIRILGLLLAGALVNGIIIRFFAGEVRGSGIDFIIDRFHNHEGRMRGRVATYKSIATIASLSTGASAGKEGPAAQIGAGIGSLVANRIQIGPRARRTMLLAGAAGGLGAVFHAPLAGALTAVEMLYREDVESDSLVPCIISSVSAYLVYTMIRGTGPIYPSTDLSFRALDLPFFAILGLLCFVCGFVFVRTYEFISHSFTRSRIPLLLQPILGAILVFAVAAGFPQVLGSGAETLRGLLAQPSFPATFTLCAWFLMLGFAKMIASSLTVGSGNSGGLFGPSLLMGAYLGLAVGTAAHLFLPGQTASLHSYALVGMGAFYSGIASAPIAGMLMVCEMTGSYRLLPGLILVTTLALVLSQKWSIYKSQLHNRFQSPAHDWDIKMDFLERARLGESKIEIRRHAMVKVDATLATLRKLAARVHASDFVVFDKEHYSGMISLKQYQGRQNSRIRPDLTVPAVSPRDTLARALRIMSDRELDKVAVVDEGRILGYVRQRDVVGFYFSSVRGGTS